MLVAISGGVDSAVARSASASAGAEVVAVTLKLWADQRTDGDQACCSPGGRARRPALPHALGIPHLTLDLKEAFRREVVGGFVAGYAAGRPRTPA